MLVIADSGRHGVKVICEGERLFFPSVVSPAKEFKMDVDTKTQGYYHISTGGQEYFVGELAVKQSEYGFEDRARDKSNENNKLLIVNAVSLFADYNSTVTLLTNIPARDWKAQRYNLEKSLVGNYLVQHKAGERQGVLISFMINKVHVLPEGAGAYYGFVFDNELEVIPGREDYLEGQSLVLEIGDETVNYITMEDGEYVDDLCGSIDLGLHVAHAEVQKYLESFGIEMNLAKLTSYIKTNKKVYSGNKDINLREKAQEEYINLARRVYGILNGKFKFTQFRKILLAGGGSGELFGELKRLLPVIPDCLPNGEGQWLNAKGFEIMYKLMQE